MLPALLFALAAPQLISVDKIWDAAPHNAFTDLMRYRGKWFCAFREGAKHVSPDGAMRVLVSPDGKRWTPAARVTGDGDLRDAKLAVAGDGRLVLNGAAAKDGSHDSLAWFSRDGVSWSAPERIGDHGFWLWRTTWRGKEGWSTGYSTVADRNRRIERLYRTADGARYETVIPDMGVTGSPSEATIRFLKDGTALCLLRRDPGAGLLGSAKPPYKQWNWKDLGVRVGGPNFIELPDKRLIAVVRLYDGRQRTALCRLDAAAGKIEELLALPSGGDSSYAGLVWHKGLLWISYYSSHEGKTSIYLAKVRM